MKEKRLNIVPDKEEITSGKEALASIEYKESPEILEDGLIQIDSKYYVTRIEEAINRFNSLDSKSDQEEFRKVFLDIIRELRELLYSKIKLAPAQVAAVHNAMGAVFERIDKEESTKSYMQAIKIAYENHLSKILPVIDENLDRVHEELDRATWVVAKDKWFKKEEDNDYALNLKELKVTEIENLKLNEKEFELIKRLCLKDDYSLEHSIKVTALSLRAVQWLRDKGEIKLSNQEMQMFAKAALLHDVGKASKKEDGSDIIPDYILKAYKQDKLTRKEYDIMKEHVPYGVRDLGNIYYKEDELAQRMINIIARHHWRADGPCYPEKITLSGEEIEIDFDPENNKDHFLAEVMAFADTIEAMTTKEKPYQKKKNIDEVRERFRDVTVNKEGQQVRPLGEQYSEKMKYTYGDDDFWKNIKQEYEETEEVTEEVKKDAFE